MLVVMEVVVPGIARVHGRSPTIVVFGEAMSLGRTSHVSCCHSFSLETKRKSVSFDLWREERNTMNRVIVDWEKGDATKGFIKW